MTCIGLYLKNSKEMFPERFEVCTLMKINEDGCQVVSNSVPQIFFTVYYFFELHEGNPDSKS